MPAGVVLAPAVPVARGLDVEPRPVMLLTFDVPYAERAVEVAIGAAVETGAELLVCDGVPIGAGDPTVASHRSFGYADARRPVLEAARAAGARAREVVYHSPRPTAAAIAACTTLDVGLLVFGADRRRIGRLRFKVIARRLRRDAPCLVWIED